MADTQELNFLQQKARDWALLVVDLYRTPVPDDLKPAKNVLLGTAKKIKETVEKVAGPIDALAPMQELGFIPVILGVGVAAAAAAIAKWTYDHKKFMEVIAERKRLMSQGMTAAQANAIIQPPELDAFSNIRKTAKYGLIGLGLFLAYKYFKR